METENLYAQIEARHGEGKVRIVNDERLKCELKRAGLIENRDFNRVSLTYEQYDNIKSFISNEETKVRKSDKGITWLNLKLSS